MNIVFEAIDRMVGGEKEKDWEGFAAYQQEREVVKAWRPIESVPIDEWVLIAATPDWVGEAIVYVDTDSDDSGREVRTYHWASGKEFHPAIKPTQWMPLPKHPEAA